MTDAERELLDAVLSGDNKRQLEARGKVLAERLPPELFERAVTCKMAFMRANKEHEAVWEELSKLEFRDQRSGEPLSIQIEAEAKRRMESD